MIVPRSHVARERASCRWLTGALWVVGCCFLAACSTSQTLRTSPRRSSTTDVSVFTAAASDTLGIKEALGVWEKFPTTCPASAVAVVSNSIQLAKVNATGVSWAIAQFEPLSACKFVNLPGANQTGLNYLDPHSLPGLAGSPIAVFERPDNGQWVMNGEGGAPFPCPAPGGAAPGPGNGAIPQQVLTAWNLSYAANCSSVSYPRQHP